MTIQDPKTAYAKIPPVQEIDNYLQQEGLKHGREVRDAIQQILLEIRQDTDRLADPRTTRQSLLQHIKTRLQKSRQELVQVINGTGAVIHTNLGRSVFSREIMADVTEIATSYTNLEFSLETGKRGQRLSNVGGLLKTLTGSEEAVVVNNNASAVLLSLLTFASGKEVIISRGELVEIGGSFRVPEIIQVSNAVLKEVGTTNRTRLQDYERAISDHTAVLLKVHTSNYQITGFTEDTPTSDLSALARKKGLLLMEDLGSGALTPFSHVALNSEPLVPLVLKEGVDIVTISGDKLLGGPQAGIILGKKQALDQIRKHPLYRALRCDKITMLLLERTLAAYANHRQHELVPTQRMLNESEQIVRQRAEQILAPLNKDHFELVQCASTPGGGSLPGKSIPSWGIQLKANTHSEEQLLEKLRYLQPPVIGRIIDGKAVIDCRTVLPHQVECLVEGLRTLFQ